MHGDGGRVVEGVEHLRSKWVPVDLRILLRHPDLSTHTLVTSLEPAEEKTRRLRTAGGRKDGKTSRPFHGAEELLQVRHVHVGLAELQRGLRVVVDVVDTHFLHDSESSLSRNEGRRLRKRPLMWKEGFDLERLRQKRAHHCGLTAIFGVVGTLGYEDVALWDRSDSRG